MVNPKENISAILLRSSKQLEEAQKGPINNIGTKDELIQMEDKATNPKEEKQPVKVQSIFPISTYKPLLHFPSRLHVSKI